MKPKSGLLDQDNGEESLRKHISEATGMAKNHCAWQPPKRHLSKRFALFEDRIYIDLRKDKWEVVEIRGEGWSFKQLDEPIF